MDIREDAGIQQMIGAVRRITRERSLSAYVVTFGCQQNEADSERLRGLASEMGYTLTNAPEKADLLLVNTCAIREHAELKALSVIGGYKRLREANSGLVIGVCGCMAAEEHRVKELKTRYPYVSFTMEPGGIAELPRLVFGALQSKRSFPVAPPESYPEPAEGIPVMRQSRHRAWVSSMYGCNNFCTYCIVPYVRGRERSRPSEVVVAEVRDLVREGVRDITLLGQNVNSYRSDCDFTGLLGKIDRIQGDFLIRFMTSHPKDVSDGLISAVGQLKHVAPHFHLPLQSGSDTVLSRMNRHYDTARYLSVVDRLRAARPGIALTSDIIVGFPGETEEDFKETLGILERVRFDLVYSFIYSARKGTPAADYPDQIEGAVAHDRMNRLLELQDGIARDCAAPYAGRVVRVLVDEPSKDGRENILSGRTDTGKLVHFVSKGAGIGEFVQVNIERAEAFALYGSQI